MSKIIQTRSEHKGILEIKFPYRFNSFGFSYHVKTFFETIPFRWRPKLKIQKIWLKVGQCKLAWL